MSLVAVSAPLAQRVFGPAHGTVEGSISAAWSVDPQIVIPAVMVIGLYLRGVLLLHRRGRALPWWRVASFLLGAAAILLALESPIDPLGEHYLTFHMVQHELFILYGAPFVLLGAPLRPVLLALPRSMRVEVLRPVGRSTLVRRLDRTLLRAPVCAAPLALALLLWHVPGAYNAALRSSVVHDAQHLSFLTGALILWWGVIDPLPPHQRGRYAGKVLALLVFVPVRIAVGAPITLSERIVYDAYLRVETVLPLGRTVDQQLGGLIMWVPGIMMTLIATGIVFYGWAESHRPDDRHDGSAGTAVPRPSRPEEGAS